MTQTELDDLEQYAIGGIASLKLIRSAVGNILTERSELIEALAELVTRSEKSFALLGTLEDKASLNEFKALLEKVSK